MTVKTEIDMSCPKCNRSVSMLYYQSVNVTQDPELLDAVLDLTVNVAECESCGQKVYMDDFFVYCDAKRKLLFFKYPASDLPTWEKAVERGFREWEMLPENLKRVDLKKRIVFGPFALKEKILLERDGLDDGRVEIYKIALFGQMGEGVFNSRHRLFYFETDEESNLLFALVDLDASREKNLVKVPKKTFESFLQETYPTILKNQLVEGILDPPFVSMEKLFFENKAKNIH